MGRPAGRASGGSRCRWSWWRFNNFNLIYLFIRGGPPIAGAATEAGSTDILLSYVYKLAFESSGRGVLYGLASAISIVVFIIVAIITLGK
jgi:ABC-type sugar transport system permease subunit